MNKPRYSIVEGIRVGEGTIIRDHVNLYHCEIGRNCKIESYVYIEEGVKIGDNVKIKPYCFIPTGVTIEDDVLVGPGVIFTNDKYPTVRGSWKLLHTTVRRGASIGARSVILPGIEIGELSLIGAGSVVTHDVPPRSLLYGASARKIASMSSRKTRGAL